MHRVLLASHVVGLSLTDVLAAFGVAEAEIAAPVPFL